MLATVLTLFFVFTMTGIGALNLSVYTAAETQKAVQTLKNQYAVESEISRTIWALNAMPDSVVNYSDGIITVAYDSSTQELSVDIDRYDIQYAVTMDLTEDTHFDHALAAETIISNGHAVSANAGNREFKFMPNADLQYFQDNAVQVHSESFHKYINGDLSAEGIHIFTGSFIELENVSHNGTLVFTGRFITFDKHFTVNADTSLGLPALVFSNPANNIWFYENTMGDDIEVNGAIHSAGKLWIRDGSFTGPIVGKVIELENSFSFTQNDRSAKYYQWNQGFGDAQSYDWPKQIGRWRNHFGTTA